MTKAMCAMLITWKSTSAVVPAVLDGVDEEDE